MTEPLDVFEKIKMNVTVALRRFDVEYGKASAAKDVTALKCAEAKLDMLCREIKDLGDRLHALPHPED